MYQLNVDVHDYTNLFLLAHKDKGSISGQCIAIFSGVQLLINCQEMCWIYYSPIIIIENRDQLVFNLYIHVYIYTVYRQCIEIIHMYA